MRNDIDQELIEAERRRQAKAATMNFTPSIPAGTAGEMIDLSNTLDYATRDRKHHEANRKAHEEAERAERLRSLRGRWCAPARHVTERERVMLNYGWAESPWSVTLRKMSSRLGEGILVALLGTRGGGKTQLGVELMFDVTANLRSARYVTAMEIFLDVKASYRKDSEKTEDEVVQSYCKPSLLILDEVHERGETPWEDRILTHIIDKRYRDGNRDTVLIANLDRVEFEKSMGKSVVSRLNETGGIIVCNWPSFRE